MTDPLEGICVADFSWVIAGPFATMHMALMGADVIRIESGTHPDLNRRIPPFADGVGGIERSGLYHALNLSKRSCTIDLRTEGGQEIALDIVRRSDVVVENFAYGTMERFNLGWERLREVKPDLIMLTSSGLGRTGPRREFLTYGPPLTALTGLASITGHEGGDAERWIGGIWCDHLSGLTAYFHLLAALEHREQTGRGQLLEYSMAEAVMAQLPEAYIDFTANGRVAGPKGNSDPVYCPHGFFPCAGDDAWVAIAVDTDEAWEALCRLMDRRDLGSRSDLATATGRRDARAELEQELAAWTTPWHGDALVALLQSEGIPAAEAAGSPDVFNDPHLRAREFFVPFEHPVVGPREIARGAWRIDGYEPRVTPPPMLGEHTYAVLTDLLGYDAATVAAMVSNRVTD